MSIFGRGTRAPVHGTTTSHRCDALADVDDYDWDGVRVQFIIQKSPALIAMGVCVCVRRVFFVGSLKYCMDLSKKR